MRERFNERLQANDDLLAGFALRQLPNAFLDERERSQPKREYGPFRELFQRRDDDRPCRLEHGRIKAQGGTRILGGVVTVHGINGNGLLRRPRFCDATDSGAAFDP